MLSTPVIVAVVAGLLLIVVVWVGLKVAWRVLTLLGLLSLALMVIMLWQGKITPADVFTSARDWWRGVASELKLPDHYDEAAARRALDQHAARLGLKGDAGKVESEDLAKVRDADAEVRDRLEALRRLLRGKAKLTLGDAEVSAEKLLGEMFPVEGR